MNLGDNIEWDIPNFDVSNPLESSSSSIQDLAYPLDYAAEMEPLDIMTSLSTPVLPAPKIRSLFQRPNIRRADTTANFMKQILNSYPIMLLQHETLPPFIHPQCVALSNEGDIEPLTNCLNLMRMISNRDIGSKKLFWKMARSECERFRVEVIVLINHIRLAKSLTLWFSMKLSMDGSSLPHCKPLPFILW